jgi:hypothetical protein
MTAHLFLLVLLVQSASARAASYTQAYSILIKGVLAGTEVVTERIDQQGNTVASSEHEIFITDGLDTKRMAFTTNMVLAKGTLSPIQYKFQYTSGESRDSCDVNVKGGEITRILNRGGHSSEIHALAKAGFVILDFSVYYQYDWVVRKYDLKKGGQQSFPNFIPLIGSEIPLKLTLLPDSSLNFGKTAIPVRNFSVEFVGLWTGTLSADKNNRLVRLAIPAQDLEVIRKDLLEKQ